MTALLFSRLGLTLVLVVLIAVMVVNSMDVLEQVSSVLPIDDTSTQAPIWQGQD